MSVHFFVVGLTHDVSEAHFGSCSPSVRIESKTGSALVSQVIDELPVVALIAARIVALIDKDVSKMKGDTR